MIRPNLEVIVEPVEGQSPEKIVFAWKPLNYNRTHLTLSVDFTFPSEVSIGLDPNIIKIIVWNSAFFVRENDGYQLKPQIEVDKKLPRIVEKN